MNDVICLEITQPMGTYYLSKLKVNEIESIFTINRREGNEGIQRKLDVKRKRAITDYCSDPDAIFPTPIILSIKSNDVENFTSKNGICTFNIVEGVKLSVVDGQHRIYGIIESNLPKDYELPVVFMFDITQEEEAYVFSTINFNQKKVDKSLIYDLFDVYQTRSPQKTCHEIAKALNDDWDSPFYRRLKILGKKESQNETLSQGTFVYHLLPMICPRDKADMVARQIKRREKVHEYPECGFNRYFMNNEDNAIYMILLNYFKAVSNVFVKEWNSGAYILTKSTGYGGMMIALKDIYELCKQNKDASVGFFEKIFEQVKYDMKEKGIELSSNYFQSSEQGQKKLARVILTAANQVYLEK
ncbi:MAG: DGQHR domain-containing protein [Butyrivibrio sp.]|jgi:DGQHR domain-containing protein|uniref:DGQHR domain-containing protein n=1 Tax=Butyrivibrio sp. TaxID=28121 RepID=UPI001EBE22F1|nr:DGQHR domain-containing protein [Butyrivibrio sp.]MBE5841223.1 DGQHR domain-containing protein [Butyrivibrio sp.]